MDSGSESSTAAAPPTVEVGVAERSKAEDYIARTAVIVLDEEKREADLRNALKDSALDRFLSDPRAPVLVVDRTVVPRDGASEGDGDEGATAFSVNNDVVYRSERTTSIVFMKKSGHIEMDKPIGEQLRVISLGEGNAYETLLSLLGKAFTPFFKSFIKESGRGGRDGDKLAPTVEKNLNDAEVALLHLQQNIEIPEINLVVNPQIQAAIQRAAEQGRKAKVADLGDLVEDSNFLNILQTGVNRWIKEIQKVTKLERDPSSGTALQEMTFWLNLERALQKVAQKRESDEVTLTLETLKSGKRFIATVSFDTDTGLKESISTVSDYNQLMKDFPLNELMSAHDFESLRLAVGNIFNHLKKIRNTKYPVVRALRFVEAISRDLNTQLLKVLNTRRLMFLSMAEFNALMDGCQVFAKWDDEWEKFMSMLRDITKKKRGEPMKMGTWKVNFVHKKLQARLEEIRDFRKQHEKLRTVIARVLRPRGTPTQDAPVAEPEDVPGNAIGEPSAMEQVDLAYEFAKEIDCFDVTEDGNQAWLAAKSRYNEQILRVEAQITTRLRDQLGAARSAREMFSIFSRYNALFIRPHIQGAIREYQTQLIERVKEDIEALQEKLAKHYAETKSEVITATHDIPPFSASIIWIRQIERQLQLYMKRVESVLGEGWANHVDGKQLKQDGDKLMNQLNTQPLFENWLKQIESKNLQVAVGSVLVLEKKQREGRVILVLKVNFAPEIIVLHKEVRNLKHMNFRIPLKVVNAAHAANQSYPFAISLLESVKTYDAINERLANKKGIRMLLAASKKEIQSQLAEGYHLPWESFKVEGYVVKLAATISQYQDRVEELLAIFEQIDADMAALETCKYTATTVTELLNSIQKAVDQLALGNYSNLHTWVEMIDKQIEDRLSSRVEEAVRLWTVIYSGVDEQIEEARETHGNFPLPVAQPVLLEIRLTAQTMYVSPTIEQARAALLESLAAWMGIVTSRPRISCTRFQLAMARESQVSTYKHVLCRLPGGLTVLEAAYKTVDGVVAKVEDYVGEWLRYQALWDLQAESLYEKLGSDLSKWMKTLVEIRKSRSTFDTQALCGF